MLHDVHYSITIVWVVVAAVWALTAFRLKPIVQVQRTPSRLGQVLLLFSGTALQFSARPHASLLDARLWPAMSVATLAGFALTVAGAALTIAARVYLGRNWSARPAIKEGHELVCNGPYALVRHPIYTGLLIAAVGTAVAFGQGRNLLALPLLLLGFWLKLRSEERLLLQAFPVEYSAYQQTVRSAIIPFLV